MYSKKVTILMTVYNETKEELRDSFESILYQSYENLEIIIIIDNPKEKWREEFFKEYNDDRIKIYVNEENIGLPRSLNRGLEYATGDYIARMDADDVSHKDRIEKQVEYIELNDYDLVGSNVQYTYKKIPQRIMLFPKKTQNIKKFLKYKSALLHPTWLAKPEVFKQLNGYRNIFAVEDYDFLLRAALKDFKMSCCPEVLYDVSLSENSISRTNSGRQEYIAEFLRKYYRKNMVPSKEEIQELIESKTFARRIKGYDRFCKMKDIRARYRNKKRFKYFLYSIMLIVNLKHSIKEFEKKIGTKIIMIKDKYE